MADRLAELMDKQEIHDVLARFMRACDRGDVAALHACYHDDAIEDHAGRYVGDAHEWVDSIAPNITNPDALMTHVLTNVLVELSGDVAVSEAYVTTTSRRNLNGGLFDVQTLARCIDRFERRDGTWRIAHRKLVMEWCREAPTSETWGHGVLHPDVAAIPRGRKFPDDWVHSALATLATDTGRLPADGHRLSTDTGT